jgi:hypothetical protein
MGRKRALPRLHLRAKGLQRRLCLRAKGLLGRLCFCKKITFPGAAFRILAPRMVPDLSKGLPEIEPGACKRG